MKAFIINRDLLQWPKALAERIHAEGHEPVLVDVETTHPPTLAWYATKPCEVVHIDNGSGPLGLWIQGVVDRMVGEGDTYAVTDADIDLSTTPTGFFDFLLEGLRRHGDVATRSALAYELEDVPQGSLCGIERIRGCEGGQWRVNLDGDFFAAHSELGMAVYAKPPMGRMHGEYADSEKSRLYSPNLSQWYRAVRARRPYVLRHMPWYYSNVDQIDADYRWFLKRFVPVKYGTWSGILAEKIGAA